MLEYPRLPLVLKDLIEFVIDFLMELFEGMF